MERTRRAVVTALFVALLVSAPTALLPTRPVGAVGPLAAVAWPTSTLVVSEVMTGGGTASDEFVELANQGLLAVDLAGLEVAYASATGATVTRKATWADSFVIEPGRRVLLANTQGSFATMADVMYSGGLAATGGAIVLRPIGGEPIDAVGWGDAANAFVEGTAAAAAPVSSSLERRPGGSGGNGADSNDNAADWFVQSLPSPQNLAAAPVPAPSPTATPSPSASPTATATPTASPTASVEPTPTAQSTPTASATVEPTSSASPAPTTEPTPTPTTTPTPSPTAEPTPSVVPIAEARLLPDDTQVTVAGVLTTALGALEAGRGAFVQDASGGIALYLDAPVVEALPAGTLVQVSGAVGDRFVQRTLRLSETAIADLGATTLPAPAQLTTGGQSEAAEGKRIQVMGLTVGSSTELADGTGLLVDDGTGQLRVVATPAALQGLAIPAGTLLRATGTLGQRDSSGTGTEGYRLLVTIPGELEALPQPTPSPSATASPSVEPSPTISPSASPSATPTPTATSSPPTATITIAAVRALPSGTRAHVEGVVTAEAGRLGLPTHVAIQDATGGLVVRLLDGPPPPRGTRLRVEGVLADPYGQLELRPAAGGIVTVGSGPVPWPLRTDTLTERIEGRLVTIQGVLGSAPRRSSTDDLAMDLVAGDRAIRVMADASARVNPDRLSRGATYRMTGIVGQRASRKGALDGYRVWIRGGNDIVLVSGPPTPNPTTSPRPSDPPDGSLPLISIARALRQDGADVAVEGTVTIGSRLLDTSGRRIVIQDGTAAVEVLVPVGRDAPGVGSRVRVVGEMGTAYGAPRLRADDVRRLGRGGLPAPRKLRGSPGPSVEWQLVQISGEIVGVTRLGDRWRAELQVGGDKVVVDGLAGSRISPAAMVEGRRATATGIVRRPYPTASDRRFSIVPRDRGDLKVAPGTTPAPSPTPGPSGSPAPSPTDASGVLDVDLQDLGLHVDTRVRVGGLVVEIAADGFVLDDGTATARVQLLEAAADYLPLLDPGDAINVTGIVERGDAGVVVVVRDPAGLVRVGDPSARGGRRDGAPVAAGTSPTPNGKLEPRTAALADPLGLGLPGLATLGSVGLVTLASVAVTLLRREQLRRRLAARVASRVAAVVGTGRDGESTGPSA